MRILFTFAGGSGHFEPLTPIARAAGAAGHEVAVVGRPAMVPAIEQAGFTAFATGSDATSGPTITPLLELSAEREDRVLRDGFARWIARERAAGILALCAEWQPDVIVGDEVDFGAMVAAERLRIPQATVIVTAAGSFVRSVVVAEALNELRAEHGLPPDPELLMLSRYLVLSPVPPSFRDPAFPLPATAHAIRPAALDPRPGDALPPWVEELDGAPTVWLSLGTVFNLESGDLFPRVLAGLQDLPINVVVTVGRQLDPGHLGPQPANVHIERYLSQSLLLPQCDLVVSHGGSGSVIGALAYGMPLVVLPMGADQPLNAARAEALGVARVLDAVRASPELVQTAVGEVLANPSYRQAAGRIRDEIAALPGPAHAVTLLERL